VMEENKKQTTQRPEENPTMQELRDARTKPRDQKTRTRRDASLCLGVKSKGVKDRGLKSQESILRGIETGDKVGHVS